MGSTFQPPIHLDPSQDPGQQTAFINQNFQQLASSLNPFIVSDGTTNRIILGKQNDGTYGLKVSQVGIDVGTATNSQLIFNSNQDVFKIALSGTATVVTAATMSGSQVVTTTVAHGLGLTPAFLAYVNVPNLGAGYVGANALQNTPFTLFTYNITPLLYVYVAVDSTNITFNVANLYNVNLSGVGGTWTFKYYVLQETAT